MPAFVRFWIKADNETEPIPDSLSQCEPRHVGPPLSCPTFESKILDGLATGSLMRHHRLTAFSAALTFAVFLTHAAPAQVTDRMRATAPEKMMPADRASKMRECEKRTEQQKTKMEDRTRFVDECVWAKKK